MNRLKQLLRDWLVDRHKYFINQERIQFVYASLSQQVGRTDSVCVYYLASGITRAQLVAYLPEANTCHMNEEAYLRTFGATDAFGNKYFFYENWFANYTFDRYKLYAVRERPPFQKHWVDIATWR